MLGPCASMTRRMVLRALAVAPVAAEARPQEPRPRTAMWVWKDRVSLPDDMPSFAEQHRLDTLFVYVSPTAADALLSGSKRPVSAVRAMRGQKRRVYAVAGEPDWARGPTDLPQHAALLVRLATTTQLFDGLHFDVEPNALPDWNKLETRPSLISGTLRFFDLLRAAAPNITLDAAANPVFATMHAGSSGNFMNEIAKRTSSISIMSYRSSVLRALDWAAPAVGQVVAAGRPWRMGVLVDDNPSEPGTSWFGTPRDTFIAAMRELDARIVDRFSSSRYAGLIFQDYDGLVQMHAT
jgi:hypothetical protein